MRGGLKLAYTKIVATKLRLPAQQRRAAIVSAAIHLFSQKGFRGTTTRELANAVGVSEPVLYMHFHTKADLYAAIIEMLAESGEGRVDFDETDDVTFFRQLAWEIVAWHVEDPTRVRILLYSALEGHELSQMFYRKHVEPFHEALAAYIRKRIDKGDYRDVDPMLAARSFVGMFVSYGQQIAIFCGAQKVGETQPEDASGCPDPCCGQLPAKTAGKHESADERRRTIFEMVDVFLRGIRKEDAVSR